MESYWQEIAVGCICTAAVAAAIVRVIRIVRGKRNGCASCGGSRPECRRRCDGCGERENRRR